MKSIHHVRKKPTRGIKRVRTKKPDKKSLLVVISYLMKQVGKTIHAQASHVVKHVKKHKRTYLGGLFAGFAVAKMVILMASFVATTSFISYQASADDIYGCMDEFALNYNPNATIDDGSCEYEPPMDIRGCTDPAALNYMEEATIDDGSCEYDIPGDIYGCMDSSANNYMPEATIDDASCTYTCGDGVTNPGETCDDGTNNGIYGYCNTACDAATLAPTKTTASIDPRLDIGLPVGFDDYVIALIVQKDGKMIVGGNFTTYKGVPANKLIRLNRDGTRDASFTPGISMGTVRSLVMQSDGKVLVAADGTPLTRLNSDGSVDESFVIGDGFNGGLYSLHIQDDGKILVGGTFTSYQGESANKIARINTDGSRDASFDVGEGFDSIVRAIDVQTNGKILVGGNFTTYKGVTTNRIIRLNDDGTRDESFDIGAGFDEGWYGGVRTIAIQNDGKILIGGSFMNYSGAAAPAVIRLNADGTRDDSFTIGEGFNGSVVYALSIQEDGKIFVGGNFISYNSVLSCGIIRLHTDGSRDESFDVGGGFNPTYAVHSVIIGTNGKIFVGGEFTAYQGIATKGVAVLDASGSRDTSFDIGNGFNGGVKTLVVQPDEKIIAGGSFTSYQGSITNNIVRFNLDSSVDESFSARTGITNNSLGMYSLALQDDGKILAGGYFSYYKGGTEVNGLIRLDPNGSKDESFDVGAGINGTVTQILYQRSSGKILIGGGFTTFSGTSANNIVRLNVDGTRDESFDIGSGFNGIVFALAIQDDGKILVGGQFSDYSGTTANGIIRLNDNGSVDDTFIIGEGFTPGRSVNAITIQDDGKILVGGGFADYKGVSAGAIIRLNSDGSKDDSFNVGDGTNNPITTILVQADGGIVLGGYFGWFNGDNAGNIIRLHADGSRDDLFKFGNGFNKETSTIVQQSDGRILVGGWFTNYNGVAAGYLVSLYGEKDLVILPNTTDEGIVINEFTNKGYTQSDGDLVGSNPISLSETSGYIPVALNLKNNNIQLDIPAEVQFKESDETTNYDGVIAMPITKPIASVNDSNVLTAFKVGGSSESVKLSGGMATLSVPVADANIGDTVQIYYSEDNGVTWYPQEMTTLSDHNGQPYVSFTTDHFTDFAIASITGSFVINDDDAISHVTGVTLTISTTPVAVQMRFSNDNATRSDRETYSGNKAWTLTDGDGEKTVYAEFDFDNDTIADASVSDTITVTSPLCSDIPESECDALVNFYNDTDGSNRTTGTNWLQTGAVCDTWFGVGCTNGQVSQINLQVNNLSGTADLSGLTSLTILSLGWNQLTSITLSNNSSLTTLGLSSNQLSTIDLSNNTALNSLSLASNQFTSIDLSNNTGLTSLDLSYNQLTGIDLSSETVLTSLVLNANQLSSIDLSNNSALTNLYLGANQLNNIDLSNNIGLTQLSLSNNQLTGINLSNNTALATLYLNNNQLTDIDLSNHTTLINLYLNDNQFASIDLTNLTWLQQLNLDGNLLTILPESTLQLTGLTSLSLNTNCRDTGSMSNDLLSFLDTTIGNNTWYSSRNSSCPAVCGDGEIGYLESCDDGINNGTYGYCNATCDGQYTPTCGDGIIESPETCDDSNTTDGDGCSLSCQIEAGPFVSCANTDIPEAECEALVNLYNSNNGIEWSQQTNWLQSNIICNNRYGVSCTNGHVTAIQLAGNNITGDVNLSGLSYIGYLDLSNNYISSIDLAGLTDLQQLYLGGNQLSSINLAGLTNLQQLYLYDNQLSSIDLAGLTDLQQLYLGGNQLSSIDLAGLTSLLNLNLADNQLSSINLAGLTNLQQLYLYDNQLSYIDLDGLTNLQSLNLYRNQLSSIDLDGLTNLQSLNLYRNQLSSIDLDGLTNLQQLDLGGNQLSSIDLSDLTSLTTLYLRQNQLSSIDLAGLTSLQQLYLNNNQLSSIDLSDLTSLQQLYLNNNQLSSIDLAELTSLQQLYLNNNQLSSIDLAGLTSLLNLNLSSNQLTTLPESIINLTELAPDQGLNIYTNYINYYRLSQPLLDFLDAKNPVSKYGDRRLTQTFTNDYNCGNSICESDGYCALHVVTGSITCDDLQNNGLTCTNGCEEEATPAMCDGLFSCKGIPTSGDCTQYGCSRNAGKGSCGAPVSPPLACTGYTIESCPTSYGCSIQGPVTSCIGTFDESSITQEQCGTVYSGSWLTEDADSCSADCAVSKDTGGQLINSVYGIGAFNGTLFSKITNVTGAVSGDVINYTLHYENNSEISGHYGVMIREYLPIGLEILPNLSGRTYVDHEVTYGGTGDVCFQQFMQSTGVYYNLADNFIQEAFGVDMYTLFQNMPELGFSGSEADVGSFFYNELCLNRNEIDNLQNCLNAIGMVQGNPQHSFPQLITVGSGCGVIGDALKQPYYYHYVGYIGTGQSGDVSFSAQVNGAQMTGLLQNRAEYFPAIIMDTDYESYQNKTEPTEGLQVTLNTEMTQISDLTVTKTLLTTGAHLPGSELQYRIDYANVGNTNLSNVRIYDSALGLSRVTADRTFTGVWYNKEYGVTGDACYADLLNETGVYAQAMDSAINAMYQQYSGQRHNWFTGNTLTSYQMMLFNPGFTGFLVDPWNGRQDLWGDYMMTVTWPNYYPGQTFVEAFSGGMGVDVTTLDPSCGTGGSYYEYTDIGNLAPGESDSIIITMRIDTGYQAGDTVVNVAYGNSKEDQTETGNNMSMVFTTLEAGSVSTTGEIILTGDNNAKVKIATGTIILVGDKVRDEKIPTITYDTTYKGMGAGTIVEGVTSLDFGGSATFDKTIEVDIPVDDSDVQYYVKADHNDGSGLTFHGLTTNPDATCSGGLVTSEGDEYNGESISAIDNEVIIYSCAASSFIAYTLDNHDDEGEGDNGVNGGGGGGAAFQKDICKPADCSASYYDRNCGGCPGDALANFLILTTHGVAPAEGMQCTQYSDELNSAYTFGFVNNITTINDCDKVNLNGELLRSHMAKMMSNFAINTLGIKPNTGTICNFIDMSKESDEMKFYANLACQLGLMGLNDQGTANETFNPNETVTRAQFGTVLSRLLRGTKNNGGTPYYAKHLSALKNVGIMTKIEAPNQTELRGFTMLMLQRIMTKAASTINSSDKDRPVWESVQEYFK